MGAIQAVIVQEALEIGQDAVFFDVIVTVVDDCICIVACDTDQLITLRIDRAEWEVVNKLAMDDFRQQDLAKGNKGFDK